MTDTDRLAAALEAIRVLISSPANDGECEHGFWHTECTNRKCWERDIRVVLVAADPTLICPDPDAHRKAERMEVGQPFSRAMSLEDKP